MAADAEIAGEEATEGERRLSGNGGKVRGYGGRAISEGGYAEVRWGCRWRNSW